MGHRRPVGQRAERIQALTQVHRATVRVIEENRVVATERRRTDADVDDDVKNCARHARRHVLGLPGRHVGEVDASRVPADETDTLTWATSRSWPISCDSIPRLKRPSRNTPRVTVLDGCEDPCPLIASSRISIDLKPFPRLSRFSGWSPYPDLVRPRPAGPTRRRGDPPLTPRSPRAPRS